MDIYIRVFDDKFIIIIYHKVDDFNFETIKYHFLQINNNSVLGDLNTPISCINIMDIDDVEYYSLYNLKDILFYNTLWRYTHFCILGGRQLEQHVSRDSWTSH